MHDEIALHGPTQGALMRNGEIEEIELTPEQAGLTPCDIADLRGGAPEENADALKALLSGTAPRAHTEAAAINTGALAWIFGKADDFKSGCELALETIRSGKCMERLTAWAEASHGA